MATAAYTLLCYKEFGRGYGPGPNPRGGGDKKDPSKRTKNKVNLTNLGHLVNGVISSTFTVPFIQPGWAIKTYYMNGQKGFPPVSTFYKGMVPNMVCGAIPEGVAFVAEDLFSKKVGRSSDDLTRLASSFLAGVVAAPSSAGLEGIMIRAQTGTRSSREILYDTLKKREIRRFFKGTVPTGIRDGLFNVGIFAFNDILQRIFREKLNTNSTFCSGILSGMIVGTLSTPFDVIKTRMQADDKGKYNRFLQTYHKIVREEGVKALMSGAGTRAALIGLCIALMSEAKNQVPPYLPPYMQAKAENE